MAVTKLFSSCKRSTVHMVDYGSIVPCMKNIASESQMQVIFIYNILPFIFSKCPLLKQLLFFQAVAQEVQSLLVSGRRKEALQCAQGGQLWGPAIILALQLGDQVCLTLNNLPFVMQHVARLSCLVFISMLDSLFFSWTVGTVLCGYSEENGSFPFCIWVPSANAMPSHCWTTCRCF